jgi:hypothetical protein
MRQRRNSRYTGCCAPEANATQAAGGKIEIAGLTERKTNQDAGRAKNKSRWGGDDETDV